MKRFNLFFTMFVALLFAQVGFSQTMVGTSHDFSGDTWNATGEICIVCHTPHNAITSVAEAPLWNHQVTAVTNYALYASSTTNATIGQPDASSKLCLSCHDGTVAMENFGATNNGTHFMTGPSLVGTSLANDHPVSFTYDAALATTDGGLWDPATHPSGIPGSGGTIATDMLIGGKMQCASCHDVHNSGGVSSLLLKSNAVSALCLTCHKK